MDYKECRDCHQVKPLSEFYKDKTEEDVLALFHYSNLQMLTPEDNLKKGDKE